MNTANGLLTANTWYHIAAVNSGGTRIVYINGVSVGLTGTALNTSANSDPIRIGSDYSSRYFSGNIDEVAFGMLYAQRHKLPLIKTYN